MFVVVRVVNNWAENKKILFVLYCYSAPLSLLVQLAKKCRAMHVKHPLADTFSYIVGEL